MGAEGGGAGTRCAAQSSQGCGSGHPKRKRGRSGRKGKVEEPINEAEEPKAAMMELRWILGARWVDGGRLGATP